MSPSGSRTLALSWVFPTNRGVGVLVQNLNAKIQIPPVSSRGLQVPSTTTVCPTYTTAGDPNGTAIITTLIMETQEAAIVVTHEGDPITTRISRCSS